jgi:hypothetical protein
MRPRAHLYGSLGAWLGARAPGGASRVTLTFAAVEALRGCTLPSTARHPRAYLHWWRGTGGERLHAWYGWQRAGGTVVAVDLAAETVTFTRVAADG